MDTALPRHFSKKQQRNPRHNIVPVLELDPAALQRGNNVDALTFHAGVHPLRMAARQAVLDGAPGQMAQDSVDRIYGSTSCSRKKRPPDW